MSIGRRPTRLVPRRPLLKVLFAFTIAAFVIAPLGGVVPEAASDNLVAVASAQAQQGIQLGPAPQVTDQSKLQPTVNTPARAGALAITTSDRASVVNAFNTIYTPALAVPAGWTGSVAGCNAGTTSAAYDAATISMVNYFRAMAGLPDTVTLDTTASVGDRQAALMMIATGTLSHTPDPSFICYTAAGATAAGQSNLALGAAGPAAIVGYMQDPGAGNEIVGHRRWILFPPQTSMGTGSTTASFSSPAGVFTGSNALNVLLNFGQRPASPTSVTWPPAAFVPYQIVYPRWSFSMPNADFSSASVTMAQGSTNISLVLDPQANNVGFADNTIVWEPQLTFNPGQADTAYTVNVNNVRINGVPQNFNYTVTIIDPGTSVGGTIGGRGLSITSSPAGVTLNWTGGTQQTGYQILRLANGAIAPLPNILPSSATTFFDQSPPAGPLCYELFMQGTSAKSDVVCVNFGTRNPNLSEDPQNFTIRADQSTTQATVTWTAPTANNQTTYRILQIPPFGSGQSQDFPGTVTSTQVPLNGITCYVLGTLVNGNVVGWTDWDCIWPGNASFP